MSSICFIIFILKDSFKAISSKYLIASRVQYFPLFGLILANLQLRICSTSWYSFSYYFGHVIRKYRLKLEFENDYFIEYPHIYAFAYLPKSFSRTVNKSVNFH